jgi:hypothetical protein
LGIPFLASITNGAFVTGYDQQAAAQGWGPWLTHASNITGWVAGNLELPALTQQITSTVFCSGTPQDCLITSTHPTQTASDCINMTMDSTTKTGIPLSNDPSVTGATYLPVFVNVASVGTPSFSPSGIDLNGIELSGSAQAAITASIYANGSVAETCTQEKPTTMVVSTNPGTAPAPSGSNLVFTPQALNPLDLNAPLSLQANLVGNNFAIPAFSSTGCGASSFFNGALRGWGPTGKSLYLKCVKNPSLAGCGIGAKPGEAQAQIHFQIVEICEVLCIGLAKGGARA